MSKAMLEHILEDPTVGGSVEAFGSVINEFPKDPELLKLFADFLAAKGKGAFAAQHYSMTSEVFLGPGRLLLPWSPRCLNGVLTGRPAKRSCVSPSAVSVHPHDESLVNRFLQSLWPAELKALFLQFSCNRFPSGKIIRNIGEPETHLWFVLAGELEESYDQLIGDKPRFDD